MKVKISALILFFAAIVLVVYAKVKREEFTPAEDFPREALVYLQVADLPQFIKLWNESELKEKYLQSANFAEFSNRHLGLKLTSRLREFEEASGFAFDAETIAALADKRAALAIYDIGKIEFVLIAPVSEEIFAAGKFVQNVANFQSQTLEDGTTIYRVNVQADRGRQKQELIFCRAKDRFVLATSEKLLAQTLANIVRAKTKNALADNPDFKVLSNGIEPHFATVWVDQTALNKDYYFKRYWLTADTENLQKIRAGIFNISVDDEKIVENRKFLLTENVRITPIDSSRIASLSKFLLANIPFYRLEKTNQNVTDSAVERTIFGKPGKCSKIRKQTVYGGFSFSADYYSRYADYENADSDFDENIMETEDEVSVERRNEDIDFAKFFQSANHQAVLTFGEPRILPAPLFVEFDRAAIFNLASPNSFERKNFELAITRKFLEQMSVSGAEKSLVWQENAEDGIAWRELKLPLLGISVCYTIVGNEIILTNNAAFLQKIIKSSKTKIPEKFSDSFAKLTVINLDQRENVFNRVFEEIENENPADGFFTGNISSFLEVISEIKQIKITENFSGNILEQKIVGLRKQT